MQIFKERSIPENGLAGQQVYFGFIAATEGLLTCIRSVRSHFRNGKSYSSNSSIENVTLIWESQKIRQRPVGLPARLNITVARPNTFFCVGEIGSE